MWDMVLVPNFLMVKMLETTSAPKLEAMSDDLMALELVTQLGSLLEVQMAMRKETRKVILSALMMESRKVTTLACPLVLAWVASSSLHSIHRHHRVPSNKSHEFQSKLLQDDDIYSHMSCLLHTYPSSKVH